MELTTHNIISIVQLLVYLPFLAIAILLCVRHGFGHTTGWLFLVVFSLSRLIGAALQLATIAQPDNISLLIGVLTLQSIGLSNFIAMMLALINRALRGTKKGQSTIINPHILVWVLLLVLVGAILGIVGATKSSSTYSSGVYQVGTLSQAGIGLTIAGFALLVIATVVVGLNISYTEPGEKRIVLAVALSLPFLLVRVIYSALGAFQHNSKFNLARGDVYLFLGLVVVEEIIIVLIIEVMGLTLQIMPKSDAPSQPGMLQRLRGGLFNRAERRFDAGYEPRRPKQAQGHRERRYERRHGGYEMQNLHQTQDSVSNI